MENFLSRESKMKHMIRSLEQERAAYQRTIERMRSCLPPDALTDVEMTQIKTGPNGKAKTAAKKPWWQPGCRLLWARRTGRYRNEQMKTVSWKAAELHRIVVMLYKSCTLFFFSKCVLSEVETCRLYREISMWYSSEDNSIVGGEFHLY